MPNSSASHGPATLEELQERMAHLHAVAGLGSRALGIPEWDWQLWRMGRDWLAAHAREVGAPAGFEPALAAEQPDVYLATQIYQAGGHTALIGDFVRALDSIDGPGAPGGAAPHLVLTNIHAAKASAIPDKIISRTGIPAANITVLEGPSLSDRLNQLFTRLLALKPRRLFLFHHPEDPLASIVAHPEIASDRILVHHADSTPSFGLHLPGVRIIDLNPFAAAMSRLLGLDPALLLLTVPDPGPRPEGFLKRGRLVTASSGTAHKFASHYAYDYPGTVAVILRSTGGWHLHIGKLDEAILLQIRAALDSANIPWERFIHLPWTESLATALWEHQCDIYFSSFPIDGARTNAEVLASATPHLRHSTRREDSLVHSEFRIEGGEVWKTWEDLAAVLRRMSDVAVLEEKSRLMRLNYERLHHPCIFAERLSEILAGGRGWEDPQSHERESRMSNQMLRSLVALLIRQTDEVRKQEKVVESERSQQNQDRSIRARILRWLMRS